MLALTEEKIEINNGMLAKNSKKDIFPVFQDEKAQDLKLRILDH